MDQVTLVAIRNPFDPHGSREIRVVEPGKTIAEHIAEFYPTPTDGYDVTVSVDGRVYDDPLPYVTRPGQSVVFCATPRGGDGKNPLAIIAMLAVLVVAPYAAIAIEGMIGIAASSAMISAAAMGITIAGGLIVNAVFPAAIPDMPGAGSFANSSTYAWTPGGNPTAEGGVLPDIYGTMRITPPIIGKYIETLGDKQYLNLLFAIAGHAVDSISGVRINDTAIEDFTGVSHETRLGAVNQAVLQYFGDTRSDVAVGAKLSESGWTLRTTTGNAVQGIGVGISLPKGLYYATDSGGMNSQTVKIYVEYSIHGADDWTRLKAYNTTETAIVTPRWSAGHWATDSEGPSPSQYWVELAAGSTTPGDHVEGEVYPGEMVWFTEEGSSGGGFRYIDGWRWILDGAVILAAGTVLNDYAEITEAQTAPIHRVFYQDNLAPGQYDIRCRLVEALPSSSRYGNDTYFESFQEIIYDDFTYPGTSLLAVRALATDQLSGSMPRIDCLVTRSTVPVWTGAVYENLPADNPAWACYHLLHKGGDGVPASRIVYSDFLSWADWCDIERFPVGDPVEGYTVNLYVDSTFSSRRALDMVGLNGRGTVVQRGSTFSCIVDRPEPLPVQRFLFTVGNIIKDSFSEEFLPMESRANAIEVTYFDAEIDYSRQTVTLYAADFDTSDQEINTTQVTLYGCTSRALAIAYGQFLLNCNRYLTLTTSFDADVDALACVTGDVIAVAHDVPQWGYSGRVVSATASGIVLDREVTLHPGTTYHVMVRHIDDDSPEELTVSSVGTETTTATLTLTTSWAKIPAQYAVCSFGEVDRVAKAMRIVRISRSQEMRRKLVCIEHVSEVYDDGAAIPAPVAVSDLPMVSRLSAREVWFGGTSTSVRLTWAGMAVGWNVYYRPSGGNWIFSGYVSDLMCQINGLDYGVTYDFAVTPSLSPADGILVSLATLGRDTQAAIPVPVFDDARCTYTDKIQLNWLPIADPLLGFFEVRTDLNWGNATNLIYQGLATSFTMKPTGASYTFYIKSHDTFLNYSASYDSITLSLTVPVPVLVSIDGSKYGRVRIEWEPIHDESYDVVEIWRSATNARGAATLVGQIHSNVFADVSIIPGATYYYWLRTKSLFATYSIWETGDTYGHSVTTATLNTAEMLTALAGSITDSQLATALQTVIADNADDIAALASPIYFTEGVFAPGVIEDFRQSGVTAYGQLQTAQVAIDSAKASIDLITGVVDFTEFIATVTTAVVRIDGIEADIGLKANQSTLDALGARVTSAEGDISAVDGAITLAISEAVVYFEPGVFTDGVIQPWTSAALAEHGEVFTVRSEMKLVKNGWTVKVDDNGYVAGMGLIVYPDWNAGATYALGDVVKYVDDGLIYKSIQAGNTNNPPTDITWWALVINGAKSEVIILADKFAIMQPSGVGTAKVPFIVGVVGGVSQVGIDGTLIVNGTVFANAFTVNEAVITVAAQIANAIIGNAHIADLDAGKINAGFLNAARLNITGAATFGAGYDPTTKEIPSGAQAKADAAEAAAAIDASSKAGTAQSTAISAASGDATTKADAAKAAAEATAAADATTKANAAQVAATAVADAAQGTANTAASNATTALASLADIASDVKITPVEKLAAKQLWDAIVVEGTATTGTIPVSANSLGVSDTDFDTKYATLNTYLNTTLAVFANMTTTTDIVRATWDTAWKNYYLARTALLNAIAAKAATMASWQNVSGGTKPADNADVTLSKLNGGLALTGGGLTLDVGGAVKGGQTDYDAGTGFFLGKSAGLYKFSVGTATDYLKFDGSSLYTGGTFVSTDGSYLVSIGKYLNSLGTHYPTPSDFTVDGMIHHYHWITSAWVPVFEAGDDGFAAVTGYGRGGRNGIIGNADYADTAAVLGKATGVRGDGVFGYASQGYGLRGQGSIAPLVLNVNSGGAPTHTAEIGSLWVDAVGILYINTSNSTTWQKVGAQ